MSKNYMYNSVPFKKSYHNSKCKKVQTKLKRYGFTIELMNYNI